MLDLPSPAAAGEGKGEGTSSDVTAEERSDGRAHPHASPLLPAREGITALVSLFLLLPLSVFALAPLVRGPMFASADGLLHLYRLVEFDQALRSGILYPRWAPDLLAGYGYPIFIFYAPGLYYLAEGFHLFGLGFVDALKAATGAGMLASLIGMYVFGRELWGRWGGLLAAAAYLYAPYRMVNTYLDGELAQTLAWAWLPWLAWASWRYLRTGGLRYGALASICYAGLIGTHSVTSWLTTMFIGLALLALLLARGARLLDELRLGGFLAVGVGLAARYWLPALFEQSYVQLDRVRIASYDFHTNLVPLSGTLSLSWAHQYSDYVGVNGPAQLGLVQTLSAAVGLLTAVWFVLQKRRPGNLTAALLLSGLAIVAFVLMLKPAAAFWEHVPFGRFLQFPDRLLAIMAFCLAALAGGLGPLLRRFRGGAPIGALLLVSALVWGATARLDPGYVILPNSLGPLAVTEYEQVSGAFGTTAKGEFTPKWLGPPTLTSPLIETELTGRLPSIMRGSGVETALTNWQPEALDARISLNQSGPVELPVAYYPGWSATLNGTPAPVEPGPHGLVSMEAPAGSSTVALRFGTTSDRWLADALGLLSALALITLLAWRAVGRQSSLKHMRRPQWKKGLAAVAGSACLLAGLALTPGKLQLTGWPAARPGLVSYSGWLQFMGGDVSLSGNHLYVASVLRTGAAQSARPVTVTMRLLTRETIWASQSKVMPVEGWTTAVPRRLEFDLPVPAGTPAGVYTLGVEVGFDGAVVEPEWTKLSYEAPRVGPVTLGAVAIREPVSGSAEGSKPSSSDFGPLLLLAWQPPRAAEQGQFVPVGLWWQVGDTPPSGDWSVSLHIVDPQGRIAAGHDDQPRLGYNPTSSWRPNHLEHDVQMVMLPSQMPPGEYTVLAGWYDVATKASVGPQNVPVGRLTVAPSSNPVQNS